MNCKTTLENRTSVWYNYCMNKALKYRLYPTKTQMQMFARTFGCCRKVWNLMLSDKIESYKTTGKFVAVTPARYKSDHPYLKTKKYMSSAMITILSNCLVNKLRQQVGSIIVYTLYT